MLSFLREKFVESLKAVTPLIVVAVALAVTLIDSPAELLFQFFVGASLAVIGMMLLFIGIDLGVLPMGRFIGAELPKKGSLALIVAVAFSLGFATTIAEPDVIFLSEQVDMVSDSAISASTVIYVIALGVAIFVAIATMRVVYGFPMVYLLTAAYVVMIALSFFTPAEFVSVAYDAGSVTTGVLTAPVVIALALGISSVLSGRSAVTDGFGLLGFASVGAIIAIMAMGFVLQ